MRGFRLNPNKELVKRLVDLVDKCNGHCPCAIVKEDTTLCPCDNFINDHECQCGMYKRVENEK